MLLQGSEMQSRSDTQFFFKSCSETLTIPKFALLVGGIILLIYAAALHKHGYPEFIAKYARVSAQTTATTSTVLGSLALLAAIFMHGCQRKYKKL